MAVKHLQGCSTGHASSFCLAISLCVKGDKTNRLGEHLVASLVLLERRKTDREGGKAEVQSLSATIRIVPQGFATRALKFTV